MAGTNDPAATVQRMFVSFGAGDLDGIAGDDERAMPNGPTRILQLWFALPAARVAACPSPAPRSSNRQ